MTDQVRTGKPQPARRTDPPAAPRYRMLVERAPVLLVAVVGLVTAEALRASGPLLDRVVAEGGVLTAALTALIVFAVPAALGLLVGSVGARRATALSVFALVVLRLVVQANPAFLIGMGYVVVALGALLLALRQAVHRPDGVVPAVTGLVLGAAADVALRALLYTWDPVWRSGVLAWLIVLAECAALVVTVAAVRPRLHSDPYPVGRVFVLGGYLALSVLIAGSPGFVASASGLSLPFAAAVLLVGAVFAVEALSRSDLPGGSARWPDRNGAVAITLLVAGIAVAILLTGVWSALGVLAAQVGGALVLTRALAATAVPDGGYAEPVVIDPGEARAAAKLDRVDVVDRGGGDVRDRGRGDAPDGGDAGRLGRPGGDAEPELGDLRLARVHRRSATGFGLAGLGAGMAYVLTVLLYQIHYELPLPFPNQAVPIVAAVLLGVAAWGPRPGSHPPADSAGGSAAGTVDRAEAASGGVASQAGERVSDRTDDRTDDRARERAAKRGRLAPLAAVPAVLLLAPVLVMATTPAPSEPPSRDDSFRMVSWNVRYARSADGVIDPEALATVIERQRPDVVLLQEVSRGWPIGGGLDGAEWLSRRLAMPYVYAPAADEQFGNLILSRLRITGAQTRELPRGTGTMRRSYARATVELESGRSVDLYDTHLTHHDEDGPTRLAQVKALLRARGSKAPAIIAGDLNSTPGSKVVDRITEAGLVSAQDTTGHSGLLTVPTDHPERRIDWIFGTPDVSFAKFRIPESPTSDHHPLAVTVHLG